MSYPARAGVRPRRTATLLAAVITAALLLPAASALAEDYVALGDSYASGTGTRTYYNESCERSVYAYNYLIQSSFGSFRSVACGGAKVSNVMSSQVSALTSATKQVTISVGGNDAGFSSVVTECALTQLPWDNDCGDANTTARNYINSSTGLIAGLNQVYTAIRTRAPDAAVTVVGYPRLFNGNDCHAADLLQRRRHEPAQRDGRHPVGAPARAGPRARLHVRRPAPGLRGPPGLRRRQRVDQQPLQPDRRVVPPEHGRPLLRLRADGPRGDAGGTDPGDRRTAGRGRLAFSSNRDGNAEIYVVNEAASSRSA